MAKENVDIGKLIDEETAKRLEVMKQEGYEWPEKADKKDVIGIALMMGVSAILILACMMGVIV